MLGSHAAAATLQWSRAVGTRCDVHHAHLAPCGHRLHASRRSYIEAPVGTAIQAYAHIHFVLLATLELLARSRTPVHEQARARLWWAYDADRFTRDPEAELVTHKATAHTRDRLWLRCRNAVGPIVGTTEHTVHAATVLVEVRVVLQVHTWASDQSSIHLELACWTPCCPRPVHTSHDANVQQNAVWQVRTTWCVRP